MEYGQLVVRHMVAETERARALRTAAQQARYKAVSPRKRSASTHGVRVGRRLIWGIRTLLPWPRAERPLP